MSQTGLLRQQEPNWSQFWRKEEKCYLELLNMSMNTHQYKKHVMRSLLERFTAVPLKQSETVGYLSAPFSVRLMLYFVLCTKQRGLCLNIRWKVLNNVFPINLIIMNLLWIQVILRSIARYVTAVVLHRIINGWLLLFAWKSPVSDFQSVWTEWVTSKLSAGSLTLYRQTDILPPGILDVTRINYKIISAPLMN